MQVDYKSLDTPSNYKCDKCHVAHCKLWIEYSTFSPSILCVDCAVLDQSRPNVSYFGKFYFNKSTSKDLEFTEEGTYKDEDGVYTDQIGWFVPAIPTEDGTGYWGYSSVPDSGILWWKRLPLVGNQD